MSIIPNGIDENEFFPSITSSNNVPSFAENSTATVVDVISTDDDIGDTPTYSIIGGDDLGNFSIVP